MREIMRQILTAVVSGCGGPIAHRCGASVLLDLHVIHAQAEVHGAGGLTHRDIKPQNFVVAAHTDEGGTAAAGPTEEKENGEWAECVMWIPIAPGNSCASAQTAVSDLRAHICCLLHVCFKQPL